jgi:hypothetical protein
MHGQADIAPWQTMIMYDLPPLSKLRTSVVAL